MFSNEQGEECNGSAVGRRRLLAALGAATAVGLAGCQEVQSQSFEADPVVLPQSGQQGLWLEETARDSDTTRRDAMDGTLSVSITSHSAIYSRAAAIGGK